MTTYYGTFAGLHAYCDERNIAFTHSEAHSVSALIVASEWLDARYGSSFPGVKTGRREQVREWPRTAAYDWHGDSIGNTEVPREVEQAAYQGALRELTTTGSLSVDVTPNKYLKAAVSGAVSVEYATFSNAVDAQSKFQIIDEILLPLISGPYNASHSHLSGSASR